MRATVVSVLCFGMLLGAAQAAQVADDDLKTLFKALQAPGATEPPRYFQAQDGFLRFIGAPPGAAFATGANAQAKALPDATAKDFLRTHAGAFAGKSTRTDYDVERLRKVEDRTYVRMRQTYNGLPVYGAQAVVQMNDSGVACVYSDIMRDAAVFDSGTVSISPTIGTPAAKNAAITKVAARYKVPASELTAEEPVRYIYDPAVLGQAGTPTVAWRTVVTSATDPITEVVLIDGHSAAVLFNYSLIMNARKREIYDAEHDYPPAMTLVRSEGQMPCGIVDADLAYDYLGDTYDFYKDVHGRDGIDNHGLIMKAIVQYCEPWSCPYLNAYWSSYYKTMTFGDGMVTDDIMAHELTHGVTSHESNLIYAYQSGAINESLSDIWGEFIDLTNGQGTDTDEVRWACGEDSPYGAGRNMQDPTLFGDPDRMGSPNYYTGSGDNGGVHYNSGVLNKMCYLITDGDTFNGQTVEGIGIEPAAKLFYEMQTNLLTESSDFTDFYFLLGQATVNLGYAFDARLNVQNAAKAVEIAPLIDPTQLTTFRGIPTFDDHGRPVISLTWEAPTSQYFRQVILVRSTTEFPQVPEDGLEVYRGQFEKYLDSDVTANQIYYYSLFVDISVGFPSVAYARIKAGASAPDFVTESFSLGGNGAGRNPLDLSYSQITFYPTGAPVADFGKKAAYGDYAQYTTTFRRNVFEFPVAREDEQGGAVSINLLDEDVFYVALGTPFPFFGIPQYMLGLSSNGFITPAAITLSSQMFPTLASHFSLPRLSPLFADLNPTAGGNIWARDMDDRLVLTFENVPEYAEYVYPPRTSLNSFQAELFYSGMIRFTYLGVDAGTAIVGLSDGHGIPVDPMDLFPTVRSVDIGSNLSELPTQPGALYIESVPPVQVKAGEALSLTVKALSAGLGIPALSAQWNGPLSVLPFVDNGDGTARLQWQTNLMDYGEYQMRVTATAGTETAYQDITLRVGVTEPLPQALNIKLRTANKVEDPTRNRVINVGTSLTLEYDYFHAAALDLPQVYGEGATEIRWYKNFLNVPQFSNQPVIPAQAVRANDVWFCEVVPVTISGAEEKPLRGMARRSPMVTAVALPEIFNVALPGDLPAGVTADDLPLADVPQASGPVTGGTTLIILGRRLNNLVSVTIGGVAVDVIRPISDWKIEIETPAHIASPVNGDPIPEPVVVTTQTGTGQFRDGFVYVAEGSLYGDINKDGKVNAIDVQLVINAVLNQAKAGHPADINRDGGVDAADIQGVINAVLSK